MREAGETGGRAAEADGEAFGTMCSRIIGVCTANARASVDGIRIIQIYASFVSDWSIDRRG